MNATQSYVSGSAGLVAARAVLMVTMLCGAAATHGAIITFQDGVNSYTGTQDTYIDGTAGLQTSPQGANTTLFVYDREHFNDPSDLRINRSLIRFDLTSLQANLIAGDTITNVTLTITSQAYLFGAQGIANSLHRIAPANAAWTEDQATWQNLDQSGLTAWDSGSNGLSVAGTDYISTALDTQNTPNPGNAGPADGDTLTFTLNDLSFLPGWINNPSTNAGFLVRQPGDNTAAFDRFYSSEASTVAFRPLLTVTLVSVPEPASGIVMLIGGTVFALVRSRHRRHGMVATKCQ